MPIFTLIKTPDTVEAAWAERSVRQQILDAYAAAETRGARAAARLEAMAYDRANPKASSLVAELDARPAPIAA
jgi:hypothetical protein